MVNPVKVEGWRQDGTLASAGAYDGQIGRSVGDVQLRPNGRTRLGVHAVCWDEQGAEVAVPSFTVTFEFAVTRITAPGAVEFN